MFKDWKEILWMSLRKLRWSEAGGNSVFMLMILAASISTMVSVARYFRGESYILDLGISLWLWFAIWLSSLIESFVEYRGQSVLSKLHPERHKTYVQRMSASLVPEVVTLDQIRVGDVLLVGEGMPIPIDGKVIEGAARVDESTLNGETEAVIREAAVDAQVSAGAKVVSGSLQIQTTKAAGPSDDAMADVGFFTGLLNSPRRLAASSKERFLENILAVYSLSILAAVVALGVILDQVGTPLTINLLIALWICLAPTTVSALLPSVDMVGMLRLLGQRIIVLNSSAVKVAGEIEAAFFDKTGTITCGYLHAIRFYPIAASSMEQLMRLIALAMQKDSSPEASSAVLSAKQWLASYYRNRQDKLQEALAIPASARFVALEADTHLGGVDLEDQSLRWGSLKYVQAFCEVGYASSLDEIQTTAKEIIDAGDSAIAIADRHKVYGVVQLHDYLKKDLSELIPRLNRMRIDSALISGDNVLTVESVAQKLGISDYSAAIGAEVKMQKVLDKQRQGRVVAMMGDGSNDALALQQADLAVVMSTGSAEPKRLADMIDLDSAPSKLPAIIKIGRQTLLARGALTTFSLINDLVKCIIVLPVLLMQAHPSLSCFNFLHLKSLSSAILAALTFGALIIPCSLPLAFWGIRKTNSSISRLLWQNAKYFGTLGVILPIIFIKLLDCWYA